VQDAPDVRAARQRWRLRFSRDASAADLSPRDEAEAWAATVAASNVPYVGHGTPPRPRLAFGPPLPAGAAADEEPLDVFLAQRLALPDIRTALEAHAPPGHRIVRLQDVWVGAPALAALTRSVEYRIRVDGLSATELSPACAALMAAAELPRERVRGGRSIAYDLRPLVESVSVAVDEAEMDDRDAANPAIDFRARAEPDRGIGRPDELVAALAELAAASLRITAIRRTRVHLADDVLD